MASRMRTLPVRTFDTEPRETPASRATSSIVLTAPPRVVGSAIVAAERGRLGTGFPAHRLGKAASVRHHQWRPVRHGSDGGVVALEQSSALIAWCSGLAQRLVSSWGRPPCRTARPPPRRDRPRVSSAAPGTSWRRSGSACRTPSSTRCARSRGARGARPRRSGSAAASAPARRPGSATRRTPSASA